MLNKNPQFVGPLVYIFDGEVEFFVVVDKARCIHSKIITFSYFCRLLKKIYSFLPFENVKPKLQLKVDEQVSYCNNRIWTGQMSDPPTKTSLFQEF